ncbi:MAG: HAD-IA family hydrolase [Ignavibacterium sp.]|nr:HAD-IA family hydrolase [Ignavibacterium sp.]
MSIDLFNLDFFLNIKYLFNLKSYIPTITLSNLLTLEQKIDFSIEGIILDVDQTVMPYGSSKLSTEYKKYLIDISTRYKCCFLSNFPKTESKLSRLTDLSKETGIEVIYSRRKKPDPLPFKLAIKYLKLSPNKVIMVGDRVFTDILGANNFGIKTALIKPINPSSDPFWMVQIPRFIEYTLYKLISSIFE